MRRLQFTLGASFVALVCTGMLMAPAHAADKDPVETCRDGISLKISGQVNHAVLYANDGTKDDIFFVDNDNSSSRIRLVAKGKITCDWAIGANFEVEYEDNSSDGISMNQAASINNGSFASRKIEWWIKGPIGKLSVGQGDTASNGTSEVDLSKTGVVVYSGIPAMMGGISFVGPGVRITDAYDQMDGMSRRNRIRYDSPTFAGFTLSTSYTDRDHIDVALRFSQQFDDVQIAAAIAYSSSNNTHRASLGFDSQLNGSIAIHHVPSGLNLTLAAGEQDNNTSGAVTDPNFYYAKLGWIAKLVSLGPTAFALDYGRTDDRRAVGDTIHTYSAAIVQHVPHIGTEFYAAVRTHEFERTAVADPDAVWGIITGARIKF